MEIILLILLLCLSVSIVILAVILLLRNSAQKNMYSQLTDVIQVNYTNTSEKIIKSAGDVRQDISDRINKEFFVIQKRIEEQLAQGRRDFKDVEQATMSQLDKIRETVHLQLSTIGKDVQSKLDENIREGFKHFEKVQEHLRAAEIQLQSVNTVGTSINELNNLLKLPHLRGTFGESSLERLLADFLPSHLYELQANLEGSGRVDALIKFPNATLPIDSKFPREQVLPLFESSDEKVLEEARRKLAEELKKQATSISKYIRPDLGTTNMALMFLPSETLYFETIKNGKLWEELSTKRVFPVSPNTLAVTLKSISIAHEYYQMAKNIEGTIRDLKKAQQHFEHFNTKFEDIGKGLDKAKEAFTTASTHLQRYSGSVMKISDVHAIQENKTN